MAPYMIVLLDFLVTNHYKKIALERPPKTDAKYQKTDATSI
jgi:hypothetical protein